MSVEAMKQMVAEIEAMPEGLEGYFSDSFADSLATLRQAIERAEKQEPVANAKAIAECLAVLRPAVKGKWPHEQALEELARYTTPQPQEFVCSTGLCHYKQREWVGLTQEDIDIAFDDTQEGGGFNEFARAIEQTLKRKNT